jgi:hypothetical protein
LPCAAQFAELGEHETDRFGHMLVGVNFDLARLAPAEASGQHEAEFAALRLRVPCREAALPHQAQLVFRHRPLQPEKQAVVDETRIAGAVRIDDQRSGHGTQINQVVPVPPIPRQARRLETVKRRRHRQGQYRHRRSSRIDRI